MKVMVTINADVAGTQQAEELKEKIVDLFKLYGLEGAVRGDKYPSGVSYSGTYQKQKAKKAKKAPPKFDPKYDPSQYIKGRKDVKKEEKKEE